MPPMNRRPARLCACLLALATGAAACAAPFTVEDLVRLKRVSDPQVSPDGPCSPSCSARPIWRPTGPHQPVAPRPARPGRRAAARQRRQLQRLESALGARRTHALLPFQPLRQRAGMAPQPARARRAEGHRLPTRRRLAQGLPARRPSGRHAGGIPGLHDAQVHARAPRCARQGQGERTCVRTPLRAPLGHLERWHARAPVHRRAEPRWHAAGEPRSMSRSGFDADIPGKPFGADEDFAFSPDGRHLVFSARIAGKSEPWSTNFDLFETPVDGGQPPGQSDAPTTRPGMRSRHSSPTVTSPGCAQARPGFEADRFHVMLRDARSGAGARAHRRLGPLGRAPRLPRPTGAALLASADELGQRGLFRIDPKSGAPHTLTSDRRGGGLRGDRELRSSTPGRASARRRTSTASSPAGGRPRAADAREPRTPRRARR